MTEARAVFPMEPLLEFASRQRTMEEVADALGISFRTLARWKYQGTKATMTIWQADKYAARLHMMPHEIWGPAVYRELAAA